jgi:hypothetical protein
MRYVRRGLLLAGIAGTTVAVVRRRRRPDHLVAADREFAAEAWSAGAAVSTEPTPVAEPATAPVTESVAVAEPAPAPEPAAAAEPEPVAEVPAEPEAAAQPEPEPEPAREPPAEPAPAYLAYLPHLQKYHQEVDQDALRGVVRHCGIALRNPDAAMVSAGDPVELKRIRDGFLKKKLALDLPDDELDAAIGELMQRMTGDRAKSRATVYYLLADRFGKLDLFR